jgi:hypothetical protein
MSSGPDLGEGEIVPAAAAVSRLEAAAPRGWRLVGRLAGGETGAHEIVDGRGRRHVLKWETDAVTADERRTGVVLTERLRLEAGWPVPVHEAIESDGLLFVVQELLPGRPMERLTVATVETVLALHDRRRGLAPGGRGPQTSAEHLITTLVTGGRGYCLHASLRDHDDRTAALLERIERFGRTLSADDLPGADLVHWDLHPGNLLVHGGDEQRLRAVIDNDFVTVGDGAFDLVTLAVSTAEVPAEPGAVERLWDAIDHEVGEVARQAYLAHLFLRILDWPIRRNAPAEIELYLAEGERLLEI